MIGASCVLALALLTAGDDPPVNPLTLSLARTEGEVALAGLEAPVRIERDALGVPVIRGDSFEDVIRAHGYVHAQDRFFQMDAARRLSAGRLSELAGERTVGMDQHYRRYRFTHVAEQIVARLDEADRRMLEAYAEGVNAGLADLAAPPPEYVFMFSRPAPWRVEDSVLVLLSMFSELNYNQVLETRLAVMTEALPEELLRFLTPVQTRFEAPLLPQGEENGAYEPAPIPSPEVVDLRRRSSATRHEDLVDAPPVAIGSNNWAVAGSRTASGKALLASDPHLRLTAPGIWYRSELAWADHHVAGVSLPGIPGIIIGANTHLAWGLTNTSADFKDLIVIDVHPDNREQYRTPDGYEPFETITETIGVRGGEPVRMNLKKTRWGVVTDWDHAGRPLVLEWTALHAEMVNFELMKLMRARTLEEAVEIARAWHGPSQNVVMADDSGRIAWVVSGYFPDRVGFDGSVPVSWADGDVGWDGPLDESLRPMIVDPEEGLLFTANNRTVDVEWAARLGDTYDLGTRARRIGDLLRSRFRMDIRQLRLMQLDTRVTLFEFYRNLLLASIEGVQGDALTEQARDIVRRWDGSAEADQPGLRILDAYRDALHDALITPLVAPCRDIDPRFRYLWFRSEEPVRRILEERPAHLLPPGHESWDTLLRTVLDDVLTALAARSPEHGLAAPWGAVNVAAIEHPLSQAVPQFASMLNMPADPLPGHSYAVRVATPNFGASMRMVVSPGPDMEGILHMPAGQSGHPMSPHYRDGHAAWLEGLPTPFRAGEAVNVLMLVPRTEPGIGGAISPSSGR